VLVTERLSEQDHGITVSHGRQQFVKHCRGFARFHAVYTQKQLLTPQILITLDVHRETTITLRTGTDQHVMY